MSHLEVICEASEVDPVQFLVVISVILHIEAGICEQGDVVRPGRCGHVDLLAAIVVPIKEITGHTKGTSARDCLCRYNLER